MPLNTDEQVYVAHFAPLKNLRVARQWKMGRYQRQVARMLDLAVSLKLKSDDELRALGRDYHTQAIGGRELDDLLPDVFALVREVSRRLLRMEHYPVQLIGGMALHEGNFVEMSTGEGKTLVATLPATLNALTDRGVHVVTVNDYLAQRDAEEMGQIYRFLGLTVGVIIQETQPPDRKRAYRASITYGTNKEFGFDYLRDDLRLQGRPWFDFGKRIEELTFTQVQRPDFHFAIVDEADSILIDEARTPLIIASAPPVGAEVAHEFRVANRVVSELIEDIDYTYDRKEKRVEWLRAGEQRVTRLLGGQRGLTGHRIDWHEACLRALKANLLFHLGVDYVLDNGEVVIVDEFTGRKMPGRQWEDGMHQAVTAKHEELEIKGQTETLARTTYQIFFNRYEKLSGMTGTAMTDARELAEVYNRPTLRVPTNRPVLRHDLPDEIFGSEEAKWQAVVEQANEKVRAGRAVLIGTRSIEKSLLLAGKLQAGGVPHVVLNALHEAEEAAIVAEAGKPGRVTVATNMAGRGTDIKLSKEVAEAGGLHVIGTERHDSRRVDNQLRGRAGRQGDPGSSQFLVSVDDPLIKRYRPSASNRLTKRFAGVSAPVGGAWLRWFFRRTQLAIERQHRKVRRQLIKYDRERAKNNRQLGVE